VYVDKLYPVMSEYRAGNWKPYMIYGFRHAHERTCPEARQ
jgi:hypothetical protein